MGYFRETLKGVGWISSLRVVVRGFSFLKIIILARILVPSQFGVFGIATLTLGFLEMVTETGINPFLIQENKKLEKYLNTAFLVSIARGVLISLVLLTLAKPISVFFRSPESLSLLILVSLVPFLRGFINPAIVKFQKDLDFHKEFFVRTTIFGVDFIVCVFLAFTLKSAESLIWGFVAGVAVELIISWLITPKPKISFDKVQFKTVINRGKWITLSGIMDYFYFHLDDVVVGRLLTTSLLGSYQVAYRISTLPVIEGNEVVNKVLFPIYTKIAGDTKRLTNAFLKVTGILIIVSFGLGLLFLLLADALVLSLLGRNWIDIIPVLKILVVFGMVRGLIMTTTSLFFAVKKQEYMTFINVVASTFLGVLILPFVRSSGIVGAAWASLISAFLTIPVVIFLLSKVLKGKSPTTNSSMN